MQNIKSRDTWSNRQVWPWSTKWSRAKANRVLARECTGQSKHFFPTRDDSTHGHHQMVNTEIKSIIFFAAKDEEAWYSWQKTRPGADCGSDHQLLIAKFRLKLNKIGKATRSVRYDLNQIPYYYAGEVTNRFKQLDLIEYLMNYGWRFVTLYRRQG